MMASIACSQHALQGRVTDEANGEPLPGVTLYIPDLKKGTATNDAGKYFFEALPKGNFLIECKLIGYTPHVQRIEINGSMELSITLSSVATELHEVVVSGISHATELKKNPIPITTINNQTLIENTSTNIIDNISRKPGMSQISTG
jgi:iron complex outermembrane receptor protein